MNVRRSSRRNHATKEATDNHKSTTVKNNFSDDIEDSEAKKIYKEQKQKVEEISVQFKSIKQGLYEARMADIVEENKSIMQGCHPKLAQRLEEIEEKHLLLSQKAEARRDYQKEAIEIEFAAREKQIRDEFLNDRRNLRKVMIEELELKRSKLKKEYDLYKQPEDRLIDLVVKAINDPALDALSKIKRGYQTEKARSIMSVVQARLPDGEPPISSSVVVWTEEMEQKLWEILAQNKRQRNAASRLLNVPIPYLLRHAAFLYETQLRGVQKALNVSIGTIGTRNRASSRASLTKVPLFDNDNGYQRPSSAMSNASKEQYVTTRGGHDMIRTSSNNSLNDGLRPITGSNSSTITSFAAQAINESVSHQAKALSSQTQNQQASTPPIGSPIISRRPMSNSSSVSTITNIDLANKQQTVQTTISKQENFSTSLSTIESSTAATEFATPAASLTMPLSRTFSSNSSKNDYNVDETKSGNEVKEIREKMAKLQLQMQETPAFLPLPLPSSLHYSQILRDDSNIARSSDLMDLRTPTIESLNNSEQPNKALNLGLQPAIKNPSTSESTSAHDSANSSFSLDSLTESELENAFLEDPSNFNNSKISRNSNVISTSTDIINYEDNVSKPCKTVLKSLENLNETKKSETSNVNISKNHYYKSDKDKKIALEFYIKAVTKEREGNLNKALNNYRKALKLDPGVDHSYRNFLNVDKKSSGEDSSKTFNKHSEEFQILNNVIDRKDKFGVNGIDVKSSSTSPTFLQSINNEKIKINDLINSFQNSTIKLSSLDKDRPVLIAKLPNETITYILHQLICQGDVTSLSRFALVCKKFLLISLETSLWRFLCEKAYRDRSMSTQMSIIWLEKHIVKLYNNDWMKMYIERPRIRLDGVYISKCNYLRCGSIENTWFQPIHVVSYYRLLRFYSDGTCIALQTSNEPKYVVKFFDTNYQSKNLMCGQWELTDNNSVLKISARDDELPKFTFYLIFKLESTYRGRFNKLSWICYYYVNNFSDEKTDMCLKNEKNYIFSK
ncbi:4703_t:CDS:10, partial [Entrophospora sp. SA101]